MIFNVYWMDHIQILAKYSKEMESLFMLLEHSLRPLKLRDKKVTPSTIIPIDIEQLKPAEYIGMKSGKRIRVLSFGGQINPAPEAKDAFYLSKVIPATLDESASNAVDGEIFTPSNEFCTIELIKINEIKAIHWPNSVNRYWISVFFYQNDQFKGTGLFYKNDGWGEALLLNGELEYDSITIIKTMRSLFKKNVECECKGLISKDYWEYRPDGETM